MPPCPGVSNVCVCVCVRVCVRACVGYTMQDKHTAGDVHKAAAEVVKLCGWQDGLVVGVDGEMPDHVAAVVSEEIVALVGRGELRAAIHKPSRYGIASDVVVALIVGVRVPRVDVAGAAGTRREVRVAARALAHGPAVVCRVAHRGSEHVDLLERGADVAAHIADEQHLTLQVPLSLEAVADALGVASRAVRAEGCVQGGAGQAVMQETVCVCVPMSAWMFIRESISVQKKKAARVSD
jgi:hypothetical protein